MKFKRGMLCGLVLMIGSMNGICDMGSNSAVWFYLFALVLGILQFVTSCSCRSLLSRRILLVIFGLEGIYYVVTLVWLLCSNIELSLKIFGIIVGSAVLGVIFSSIYTLIKKCNL